MCMFYENFPRLSCRKHPTAHAGYTPEYVGAAAKVWINSKEVSRLHYDSD